MGCSGWPPCCFLLSGIRSRGQACEAGGRTDAAGWEEEAIQQFGPSKGPQWGGDGGLPHEALPPRWSHGFIPGSVTSPLQSSKLSWRTPCATLATAWENHLSDCCGQQTSFLWCLKKKHARKYVQFHFTLFFLCEKWFRSHPQCQLDFEN